MKKFLSVICCACFLYAGYSAVFADEPVYKEYKVREDVREVIFRIEQANKLNSKHIYPGQVLKVPLRVHDNGLMVAER